MNIPEQALDAAAGAISQMISGFLRRHEPLSAGQAATAALEAALPEIEKALRTQIAADIRPLLRDLNPHRSEHDAGAWHGVSLALNVIEEGNTK